MRVVGGRSQDRAAFGLRALDHNSRRATSLMRKDLTVLNRFGRFFTLEGN